MRQPIFRSLSSANSRRYNVIRLPADFARNTIAYAQAKTAYFTALREEMPELINIATGRQPRPLQLDKIAAVFSSTDEKQKMVAEQKTMMFLKRFSGNPNVKKARWNLSVPKKSSRHSIRISHGKTSRAKVTHRRQVSSELNSPLI
jgi:hypothetical protein